MIHHQSQQQYCSNLKQQIQQRNSMKATFSMFRMRERVETLNQTLCHLWCDQNARCSGAWLKWSWVTNRTVEAQMSTICHQAISTFMEEAVLERLDMCMRLPAIWNIDIFSTKVFICLILIIFMISNCISTKSSKQWKVRYLRVLHQHNLYLILWCCEKTTARSKTDVERKRGTKASAKIRKRMVFSSSLTTATNSCKRSV